METFNGIIRQISDSDNASPDQLTGGSGADIQQVRYRKRPYALSPIIWSKQRDSIRFLHITAQLSQHLAEGDADGNCKS